MLLVINRYVLSFPSQPRRLINACASRERHCVSREASHLKQLFRPFSARPRLRITKGQRRGFTRSRGRYRWTGMDEREEKFSLSLSLSLSYTTAIGDSSIFLYDSQSVTRMLDTLLLFFSTILLMSSLNNL